jgi:hypothetical protein
VESSSKDIPSNVADARAARVDLSGRKEQVERQLHTLRDANRLAMHVCEERVGAGSWNFEYPRHTNMHLSVPSEKIDETLLGDKMPMLSMTFFPSKASNRAIKPFPTYEGTCTYLFDLDDKRPNPAKVMVVSAGNIDSGDDVFRKDLKRSESLLDFPALADLYDKGSEWEWKTTMALDKTGKLSARQLDALGDHYMNLPHYIDFKRMPHNEIIVAASKDHRKAIMLPFQGDNGKEKPWKLPLVRLMAAFNGLEHIKRDVDLPVVLYQMSVLEEESGLNAKLGDFTYVGQGKQELSQILLDSILQLKDAEKVGDDIGKILLDRGEENGVPRVLFKRIIEEYGINLWKPLDTQAEALQKLRVAATGVDEHREI